MSAAEQGPETGFGAATMGLGLLGPLTWLAGCQSTKGPTIDSALQDLSARSPAMRDALPKIVNAGWTFAKGPAGDGTSSDPKTKVITIDENDLANAEELARSLAHEVGHAAHQKTDQFDGSMDHDAYVRANTWEDLKGESAATIMELRVRDDLIAGGGSDIGITGATSAQKIALWEQHQAGRLSEPDLIQKLAELFASGETTSDSKIPYWDHYAPEHHNAWVRNNPGDSHLPIPRP